MNERTAADALSDLILARHDFLAAYSSLERLVAHSFLGAESSDSALDATAANHLLRYADVLSHASGARHRELAYATVALLKEHSQASELGEDFGDRLAAVAEAVLVQLGNFPGIRTLQKGGGSRYALPMSRGTVRIAKEILQKTHQGDAVLTDAQYEITERLRGEDYFSFSGPTSLGKSFIIKDVLYGRRSEGRSQRPLRCCLGSD